MRNIKETVERHSLTRLLKPEMHIDQFKSKMGDDADIIVISFKVTGKDPALDMVDFMEKGYEWVLDADTSAGELDDGDYLVFTEMERTQEAPAQLVGLIEDLTNLADFPISEWKFSYHRSAGTHEITEEKIAEIVPLTKEDYEIKFPKPKEKNDDIDKLKAAAGVKINTKAPVNDFTESLRIAAGIR